MTGNDLLPSWNDGAARTAILEFVQAVTGPGPSRVPPADRIATFDNDGTLWCEKPQYVEAEFVFRRWREMIAADPAKANEQPYKALAEDDQTWLSSLLANVPDLVKGVTEAYVGITVGAFEEAVRESVALTMASELPASIWSCAPAEQGPFATTATATTYSCGAAPTSSSLSRMPTRSADRVDTSQPVAAPAPAGAALADAADNGRERAAMPFRSRRCQRLIPPRLRSCS
jgi:hypothetical protein